MRSEGTKSWGGLEVAELGSVNQMPERRAENKWGDPRFLVAMLALLVGIFGNWWSSHAADSARAARTDSTLELMAKSVGEIKASNTRTETIVQGVATTLAGTQSEVKAHGNELADIRQNNRATDGRVSDLEKAVAKLQARAER